MTLAMFLLFVPDETLIRVKPDDIQRFVCTMKIADGKEVLELTSSLECRVKNVLHDGGFIEERTLDRTRMKIGQEELDVTNRKTFLAEIAPDGTLRKITGKAIGSDEGLMWALISVARPSSKKEPAWSKVFSFGKSETKLTQKFALGSTSETIQFESETNTVPPMRGTGTVRINSANGWTQSLDAVVTNVRTGKGDSLVTVTIKLEPI